MGGYNIFLLSEALAVCVETYTVYCLHKGFFQASRRERWQSVLAYLAFGAVTGFFSVFYPSMGVLPAITFACIVCVSAFLYRAYFALHFFAAFALILVGIVCDALVSLLHSGIFGVSLERLHEQGPDRILGMMASKLLCLIATRAIAAAFGRHRGITTSRMRKAIPLIACQLAMIVIMAGIFISAYMAAGFIDARSVAEIVALMALSVFIFLYYDMMADSYEREYENRTARIRLNSQIAHQTDIKEQQESLLSVKHDMRMFLNVVDGLISGGCDGDARKYRASLEEFLEDRANLVFYANVVVSAILNDYLRRAAELGVRAECRVSVPESLGIDDIDLTIILGNILENALRALESVEDGGRRLSITLRQSRGLLLYEVVNTFSPDKAAASRRGRGLDNVKRCVKKYGGDFVHGPRGNEFTSTVILNSPDPPLGS